MKINTEKCFEPNFILKLLLLNVIKLHGFPYYTEVRLCLSSGQSGSSDLYGHRSPSSPNPETSEILETSQTVTVTEPVIAESGGLGRKGMLYFKMH